MNIRLACVVVLNSYLWWIAACIIESYELLNIPMLYVGGISLRIFIRAFGNHLFRTQKTISRKSRIDFCWMLFGAYQLTKWQECVHLNPLQRPWLKYGWNPTCDNNCSTVTSVFRFCMVWQICSRAAQLYCAVHNQPRIFGRYHQCILGNDNPK